MIRAETGLTNLTSLTTLDNLYFLFFRVDDQLPDNFGVDWASGVYGPSTIAHVLGAWQIYEHSADIHFLEQSYQFYKELYWEAINGKHWLYAYDAGL